MALDEPIRSFGGERNMSDDPILPPNDDMIDVQTPWGLLPRWKARALAIGEIQAVINDAADQPSNEKPAPLTADQSDPIELLRKLGKVRELRRMAERCDELLERYDLLEQRERLKAAAHDALMKAEAEFTPEPSPEDIDGMTMN
jgi:hypothetical protein